MTLREKLKVVDTAPTGLNIAQLAAKAGVRYNILYTYVVGIRAEIPYEDEKKIRAALEESAKIISDEKR